MFYVLLNMPSKIHAWKSDAQGLTLRDSILQGFDTVQMKPANSAPHPPAAKAKPEVTPALV